LGHLQQSEKITHVFHQTPCNHEDKKEEIADGLTVSRREGDLDRLGRWRSGALTDSGAVDRRGIVDPYGWKDLGKRF